MATVTGAMTTSNVLSNQLAIDIGKRISLLEPNVQILTVLTREIGAEATIAKNPQWLEDESKARFDTFAAAFATTTTTELEATHGEFFQQWDLILNTRTGELMRVDSVVGNKVIVTRAIGSTATAILEGDEIYIVGTAQPENDTSKVARAKKPTLVENYTEIFRTPYEISETAANVGYMVMPKEWERLEKNAAIEHAKDIELAMLFGRKSKTTPGQTEVRTMAGLTSFITSNQTDAGGILSEAEFNAFMLQVMRYNQSQMFAMCSGAGLSALNKFPASKQITKQDETKYGMNVSIYMGPFGSIRVAWHRLLEGAKYGGYIIAVDLENVKYRPLTNRDTQLLPNRQPPDQDGRKSEFLTECSLQVMLQRKHGILSGITG